MRVVSQWKAFTYTARLRRNGSFSLPAIEDVTDISLIQKVDPPPSPPVDPEQEERTRILWEKMLGLRHEINRLKEKFHIGGG